MSTEPKLTEPKLTQPKPTERSQSSQSLAQTPGTFIPYFLLGVAFGVVLTKSEVLSWFRIQEMFRFQSPRMYEIIVSAILVAAISVALIKRLGTKTISHQSIYIRPKTLGRGVRYAVGGTIFGLGWALTGACPGPLFALVGNGVTVMAAAILSALAGTWLYGALRPRLPH
jgi:uncharacterized protein